MSRLVATVASASLGLLLACGGSQATESGQTAETKPAGSPDQEEVKIRRAQLASCGPVCERLVDCSVEDLREQKTAAEIAEMDLPRLLPKAVEDCEISCREKTLSPRQIGVMQECVNGPQECSEYVTCLDQAKRGS